MNYHRDPWESHRDFYFARKDEWARADRGFLVASAFAVLIACLLGALVFGLVKLASEIKGSPCAVEVQFKF